MLSMWGERSKDSVSHFHKSISWEQKWGDLWWNVERGGMQGEMGGQGEEGHQNLYLMMPLWNPMVYMLIYKWKMEKANK